MFRKFLVTTAMAAIMTTGAMAADNATKSMDSTDGKPFFSQDAKPMESDTGFYQATPEQILASTLIGKSVYNGTGENAEAIGDVNDVVMGQSGMAEAVVIGVGGFLGIGEKNVAIDFSKLNWVEKDGELWVTTSASKQELESAPNFERTAMAGEGDMKQAADATADKPAADTAMTAEKPAAETAMTDDKATKDTMAPSEERTAAISTEGWSEVDRASLSTENLLGTRVYGSDDADLGEIGDVIVSTDGKVEAYVIDVGGFLGIGEKSVALDAAELKIMKNADGDLAIHTGFTEEQLKSQAAYDADAYKADRNSVVLR